MPGGAIQADMLSGIEEESDIYEGFAPHVDFATISISHENSPGKCLCLWYKFLYAQNIQSKPDQTKPKWKGC